MKPFRTEEHGHLLIDSFGVCWKGGKNTCDERVWKAGFCTSSRRRQCLLL